MKLNTGTKIFLVIFCLALSFVGFLIKLPSLLRHIDKEMHTAFYFLAAAFLNLLFAGRNILKHSIIFIVLYLFGTTVEYAQEYSNKLLHKRIHGRYDIEDVQANLKGLVLFSILWITYNMILFAYGKLNSGKTDQAKEV